MSRYHTPAALISAFVSPESVYHSLVQFTPPIDLFYLGAKTKKIRKISCNPICAAPMERALIEISMHCTPRDLEFCDFSNYAGCYAHRVMRGSSKLSAHAYGIAFDFSPVRHPLHRPFDITPFATRHGRNILAIMQDHGFRNYGKDFGSDAMHFEFINI